MDKMILDRLQNPPNRYRPVPFWSWNEKLDEAETRWQIDQMEQVGIGGFFMHARGGLQTPYLGKEWMDNIRAGLEEGRLRQMGAWGYDENGWPSGFGDGKVNGLGLEYQQKYLRYEITDASKETEHTIGNLVCEGKNLHFYYDVNAFYVDTLDAKVTKIFLETVHSAYQRSLGEDFSKLAGFFTDEPQISRNGIPWSFVLPSAYQEAYGEELLPLLPSLFFATGDWRRTRFRFWKLVRDLFAEGYMKQIHDWCQENQVRLTGHMVLEETVLSQITSNGACMPSYEYMDIPGMDLLGRRIGQNTTPLQVASVAHQLGKKQVLSETFALCGWNVSFEELKHLYEWQMVRGVNLLCQHLEGYSLRGIRKRDYPATLFYQQPWWGEDYRRFNDAMSRIGMLLADGRVEFDVLLLHPQSSGWICFDNRDNEGIEELEKGMTTLAGALEDAQVPFHYGDERILARHGKVVGKKLQVGTQQYSLVIVPPCLNLSKTTYDLLYQFKRQGGTIFWSEEKPVLLDGEDSALLERLPKDDKVISPETLAGRLPDSLRKIRLTIDSQPAAGVGATVRYFDDQGFSMYYFVNTSHQGGSARAVLPGDSAALFDYQMGELVPVDYVLTGDGKLTVQFHLEKMGSAVLFLYNAEQETAAVPDTSCTSINHLLSTQWEIGAKSLNTLTLDFCDCYFNGQLFGKHIPVNNLQEEACVRCEETGSVEVEMRFPFQVSSLPDGPLYLVMETPEKFSIFLNGQEVKKDPCGFFWDKSFVKLVITPWVQEGENLLVLKTVFHQSPEVLAHIQRSLIFESEKNKLSYDDELEAVYLAGDFGVALSKPAVPMKRDDVLYDGTFALTEAPKETAEGSLVEQGYPFFSGTMTFVQKVTLTAAEIGDGKKCLQFAKRNSTITRVRVNGKDAGHILWRPYQVSLDGLLQEGENVFEVEVVGNLRNLLGPHHCQEGESYSVGPGLFFQNSPIWCGGRNPHWTDHYSFVEYGLFLEREPLSPEEKQSPLDKITK